MSLNYDIQTDVRYCQGIEKGIEKGFSLGEMQAIRKVVISTITKFPSWSDAEVAELANTSVENVAAIRAEISKQN